MLTRNASDSVDARRKGPFHTDGMSTLGSRIRQARQAKELTQQQVADAFGSDAADSVSRPAVAQWEADEHAPTMDKIQKLSEILDASGEWLLTGNPKFDLSEVDLQLLEVARRVHPSRLAELFLTLGTYADAGAATTDSAADPSQRPAIKSR